MTKLILASTCKFKSKIMNQVHLKHELIKSDFEEISNSKNIYDYVRDIALGKAKSVEKKVKEGIIISLDTVVLIDNKIVEKPKNIEEAKNNLFISQNKTTSVVTGIAIINKYNGSIVTDCQETKITLRKITKDDINYYIENEPDAMYVSGYIVENIVSNFIEKIDGSFYNILGIPVEKIYEHLNKWGIYLNDLNKKSNKL